MRPPSGVVHATDALRVDSGGSDFGMADELFGGPVEYRVVRRRRNPGRRAAPASQAARDRRRTAAAVAGLPATRRQPPRAVPACQVPPLRGLVKGANILIASILDLRDGLGEASSQYCVAC